MEHRVKATMEKELLKSEWSADVQQITTIRQMFTMSAEAAITLDANNWFNLLTAVGRELSTEMKPEQKIYFREQVITLNDQVQKCTYLINEKGKSGIPPALYLKLHDFDLNLREVWQESGMRLKKADDARKALRS